MIKPAWEGFFLPTRVLTEKELELLSPRCWCGLPAYVVEAQQPLTEQIKNVELIELPDETLCFYCARHSPMTVNADLEAKTNMDFYATVSVPVLCPDQQCRRYAAICLIRQPRCLKRCMPIQNLLGDVTFQEAKTMAEKGRAHQKQTKGVINNGT